MMDGVVKSPTCLVEFCNDSPQSRKGRKVFLSFSLRPLRLCGELNFKDGLTMKNLKKPSPINIHLQRVDGLFTRIS